MNKCFLLELGLKMADNKNSWKCIYLGMRVYVYLKPDGTKVYVDGKFANGKHHPDIYQASNIYAKNGGYAGMDLGKFLETTLDK